MAKKGQTTTGTVEYMLKLTITCDLKDSQGQVIGKHRVGVPLEILEFPTLVKARAAQEWLRDKVVDTDVIQQGFDEILESDDED